MQPLLSIQNLSINFTGEAGTTQALRNVSLDLRRGEVLAIVGESGSGKSITSLSVLQLLPSPPAQYSSGKILFSEDGHTEIDLLQQNRTTLQDIRGNRIAMIFQEPMTSLNPVFTCGDQVMEAILTHKRIGKEEAKAQAIEWFQKVQLPHPHKIFDRYPHQLSGGQKQRVMIAIAMCCSPSILICDEPTTALDVTVQKTILQLIKQLQEQSQMGVIFITHDLGVVAEVADKAAVMYKGEIVEENEVRTLFTDPKHPYTKALLACRPVNHQRGERLPVVSDFMSENPTGDRERSFNVERVSSQPKVKDATEATTQDNVLISVDHLSVWFPSRKTFLGKPIDFIKAVDDVSFEIHKGETLGLVGESGCGKTTLGRALLRLVEAHSGSIMYKGFDLLGKSQAQLRPLRKDVQIIFQDPYSSLNPRLTIGDAIAEPMQVHDLVQGKKARRNKVIELLEKVNLQASQVNRYPHEFSGGQRQRIVIARALALNPSFIVCDESVSALDVSVQAQVLNLLNDLKREYGFTVVFISHDLSVVRYISDRIMVMNQGKIVESGKADNVYFHPQSAYTKNLIASIPKGFTD